MAVVDAIWGGVSSGFVFAAAVSCPAVVVDTTATTESMSDCSRSKKDAVVQSVHFEVVTFERRCLTNWGRKLSRLCQGEPCGLGVRLFSINWYGI
ncbi:hypothetical protein FHS27_003770 [Rhodopirellula rubra]|uniref:Uncharacterized protein n=1 Tax=Aporhodopirellula rubra TaxID=980271 RepID=A0A7W5E1G8_9BACT|nr:hypothetical protein [Aporhodopirellula rubra]